MKKSLKGIALITTALMIGAINVNASTTSKKIDTSKCDKIYTNYYLLLEANTTDYFNGTAKRRNTIGEFTNNRYLTNFNENNVGYGQVNVSKSTTTSNDKITSWSLNDYYANLAKVGGNIGSNVRYTEGNTQYFAHGSWVDIDDGTKRKNYTVSGSDLNSATVNATSSITRLSEISNNSGSNFKLSITRNYDGQKAASSVKYDNQNWMFHPAVYYVQYCSINDKKQDPGTPTPEDSTPVSDKYKVIYIKNTNDTVTNMPTNVEIDIKNDVNISDLTPKREGYKFLGWSTKPDDSTGHNKYVANYNYTDRKDLTLYAIWEKDGNNEPGNPVENFYKVIYLKNTTDNVINMPVNIEINVENNVYISNLIPKREGYTFLGWSTTSDDSAGHTKYIANFNYTDRKDLTLYAIWQKNSDSGNPENPGNKDIVNPKTAVSDYIVPVTGVASSASAGIALLRRKRFFKQL